MEFKQKENKEVTERMREDITEQLDETYQSSARIAAFIRTELKALENKMTIAFASIKVEDVVDDMKERLSGGLYMVRKELNNRLEDL